MIKETSCGGVVIYKWKVLLLYKNHHGRYMGWVLPKGAVEKGESFKDTALREVKEETGSTGEILRYVGKTQYSFKGREDRVLKSVHWYLMKTDSFYCVPQKEEHFESAVFYKYQEACRLLKYNDERQMVKRAFRMYNELTKKEEHVVHQ